MPKEFFSFNLWNLVDYLRYVSVFNYSVTGVLWALSVCSFKFYSMEVFKIILIILYYCIPIHFLKDTIKIFIFIIYNFLEFFFTLIRLSFYLSQFYTSGPLPCFNITTSSLSCFQCRFILVVVSRPPPPPSLLLLPTHVSFPFGSPYFLLTYIPAIGFSFI